MKKRLTAKSDHRRNRYVSSRNLKPFQCLCSNFFIFSVLLDSDIILRPVHHGFSCFLTNLPQSLSYSDATAVFSFTPVIIIRPRTLSRSRMTVIVSYLG